MTSDQPTYPKDQKQEEYQALLAESKNIGENF